MVDFIGDEYMIPILFEGTETLFTSNGLGRLSDAISCLVTENRNGAYELEMKYPIDGIHFSDLKMGRYIFAKPAKYSNNQPFEIYQITRPLNGVCTVYAYHISYRLSKIPVMPFTADNIGAALTGLETNSAETNPFTFSTTKTTVANYNQDEIRDCRSCLGGVQGSILDVFGGGDYEFDMFNVKLWADRGQDRGFEIRYGKNLTDIKQEESIENTITGVAPFYKNDSTIVTLPEMVIETASASNYPYPRTVPLDLSSEFEDSVPTEAQLRDKANAYIASHDIGVPKVSLDVSFVNLADMVGYEDIAVLEDIRLCDTVKVVFDKLGVSSSAKVISTEYDTLKEKFTKVGLGASSNSLANTIAEMDKKQEQQSSVVQSAIDRATNLITGVSGGYVVIRQDSEGKPYEILIMDNEDIAQAVNVWRWNKNGLGYSDTGYNGTYALAMTSDGEIVADFITTGILRAIDIIGVNISGSKLVSAGSNNKSITIENGWIDCVTNNEQLSGLRAVNGNNKMMIHAHNILGYSSSGINTLSLGVDNYGFLSCSNNSGNTSYYNINCQIAGDLVVNGIKGRLVKTRNYNDRELYCYETPSPMFGDIGEGKTDESGICEIWLDDIFGETIDLDIKYQVFLQMYSEGSLRVTKRNSMFFRVEGTPNASFAWELKAVQRDYDTMRLEEFQEQEETETDYLSETYNYLESLLYDVEGEVA